MKIVIVYKWSRNSEDAAVRADGSVDWRNAKNVPGEDDAAALDAATAIASGLNSELTGLTIGDGDASWALARGVTSTVSITDAPNLRDEAATARTIAAGVRSIGEVTHVVLGDPADHPLVAAALAAELGFPCVLGVSELTTEGEAVIASRHDATQVQNLKVEGPAVFGVVALSADTKKPGMKEMLAARKRPVTTLTSNELGIETADGTTVTASRAPEGRSAKIFGGTPDEAAQALVAALRSDGVLA
ncbi:electron transfer flavoprotein subunit beta/FixA family protein [Changpingibacter yushuensis]|uniref:electron transfer flavoprotein subunit beta/FixA family protein n=1 Tax=Changpingibacter yushuensis TaxID=2758440 RepID=UPI00165E4CEF|nr:electron transfer flavoprotein subunit alpha [Changpingibacter yushuensis]